MVGVELIWKGKSENEIGIEKTTGKTLVKVDEQYFRPNEVELLIGDASKALKQLGWKPKTSLEELCKMMVNEDLRRNKIPNNGGITF